MSRILVPWIATLVGYSLIGMGGLFGDSAVGILYGLGCLWAWIAGNIHSIDEYWQGKAPDWMVWLADKPGKEPVFSWYNNPKSWKIASAVAMIFAAGFGFIRGESAMIGFSICLILTWAIGVVLIERHFRRNYTKMTK